MCARSNSGATSFKLRQKPQSSKSWMCEAPTGTGPSCASLGAEFSAADVRKPSKSAHTVMKAQKAVMAHLPQLSDQRILRPAETALALNLITRMDFLRLKAIARLYARDLPPDVGWDDLLQEAFTRVIVGTRRKPPALSMVSFIVGIMRSLRR